MSAPISTTGTTGTTELQELAELLYAQLDPALAGPDTTTVSATRAAELLRSVARRTPDPLVQSVVADALADLARVSRRRRCGVDVTGVVLAAIVEIETAAG